MYVNLYFTNVERVVFFDEQNLTLVMELESYEQMSVLLWAGLVLKQLTSEFCKPSTLFRLYFHKHKLIQVVRKKSSYFFWISWIPVIGKFTKNQN